MHSTKRVKMQLLPLHNHPELMPAVCTMLNNQWPRSDTARIMWLRGSTPTLPTSYVLVDTEHNVLGHARVAASLRVGGTTSGVSGIVTSVIIHPEHRRKGMGRSLLSLVEACCRHRFGRVVLWTSDQVSFYESCGYVKCSPLRVVSSAASKLDAKGLREEEVLDLPKEGLYSIIGYQIHEQGAKTREVVSALYTKTTAAIPKPFRSWIPTDPALQGNVQPESLETEENTAQSNQIHHKYTGENEFPQHLPEYPLAALVLQSNRPSTSCPL